MRGDGILSDRRIEGYFRDGNIGSADPILDTHPGDGAGGIGEHVRVIFSKKIYILKVMQMSSTHLTF